MSNIELGLVEGLSREQVAVIFSHAVGEQFNLYETQE